MVSQVLEMWHCWFIHDWSEVWGSRWRPGVRFSVFFNSQGNSGFFQYCFNSSCAMGSNHLVCFFKLISPPPFGLSDTSKKNLKSNLVALWCLQSAYCMYTISIPGTATTQQNDIPVHTECFYCNLRWNDDMQLKIYIYFPFSLVFFFVIPAPQKFASFPVQGNDPCTQNHAPLVSMLFPNLLSIFIWYNPPDTVVDDLQGTGSHT